MIDETVWKDGEKLVCEYMKENGYEVVYTNYRCLGVEVDIVAILRAKIQVKKLKTELKEKLNKLDEDIKKIKSKKYKKMDKSNPKKIFKVIGQIDAIDKLKAQKKALKISYKAQIAHLDDILVVTEVKSRSSDKFGTGAESISEYKMNNIKKAGYYLLNNDKFKDVQIRFDVASVDGDIITYIDDAF